MRGRVKIHILLAPRRSLCYIACMQEDDNQSEFKDNVKLWLKANGRSYGWMADKCGVSEITFRNWMSQKSIPALKQKLLQRAMGDTAAAADSSSALSGVRVDATLSLTIQLQADVYHKLEMNAARRGLTAGELIAGAISALVEES